jgi:N,N'-diacetyllegionaminate synthase
MHLEQKIVSFGDKKIGDGHPCFIVLEAGPTHDGMKSAKELVRLAAEAGADAVKFQILDPDRLVADKKQMFTFDILVNRETGETKTVQEPLYDLLKRRSMSKDEWRELKKYSDSLGLAFFATVGFEDEVELARRAEMRFHQDCLIRCEPPAPHSPCGEERDLHSARYRQFHAR